MSKEKLNFLLQIQILHFKNIWNLPSLSLAQFFVIQNELRTMWRPMSSSCHIWSRQTWNLCFLVIFSWKKLRPNLAFWDTFKLLRCLNSRDKASNLNKSDLYSFRSDFCSAENLKENKDSKFDDNFNTSNMTWTRHKFSNNVWIF